MAEIIKFSGLTSLPEPPKTLLQKAKKWGMKKCIVIGTDAEGKTIFGGSFSDAAEIVLLLELAKKFVLENDIARSI